MSYCTADRGLWWSYYTADRACELVLYCFPLIAPHVANGRNQSESMQFSRCYSPDHTLSNIIAIKSHVNFSPEPSGQKSQIWAQKLGLGLKGWNKLFIALVIDLVCVIKSLMHLLNSIVRASILLGVGVGRHIITLAEDRCSKVVIVSLASDTALRKMLE